MLTSKFHLPREIISVALAASRIGGSFVERDLLLLIGGQNWCGGQPPLRLPTSIVQDRAAARDIP